MAEISVLSDPAGLSDEALEEALSALQTESAKRGARIQARAELGEALAAIRPAIVAYAEATGKTVAQVFKDCSAIFKELPEPQAGVIAPEPEPQPQPWRDGVPTPKGAQVIYNGEVYESLVEGNLYSPAIDLSGWERKGPAHA